MALLPRLDYRGLVRPCTFSLLITHYWELALLPIVLLYAVNWVLAHSICSADFAYTAIASLGAPICFVEAQDVDAWRDSEMTPERRFRKYYREARII